MKTEFTFQDPVHKEVTATPEKAVFNGVSGNFWTFFGYDDQRDVANIKLHRTFMADRTPKRDIVDHFQRLG